MPGSYSRCPSQRRCIYGPAPGHPSQPYSLGMTSLRAYLAKSRRVQHPGSKGGKYYIDHNGEVVYGERPAVRVRGTKRGTPVDIHIEGHTYEAEHLGKGQFAKAFRFGPHVYLFVKGDYSKEMVGGIHNPHVPEVEYVSDDPHDEETRIYKMPYYEPLTAQHPVAWQQYRILEELLEDAQAKVFADRRMRYNLHYDGYAINQALVDLAREDGRLPDALVDALENMSDAASNYGSGVSFELGKRNLGVNKDGQLVLRDVLFDSEALTRKRAKQRRRQRGW